MAWAPELSEVGRGQVVHRSHPCKPMDPSEASLVHALQFADIFVSESNQAFVHLAQDVQEYGNIDLLILVVMFQRLEPAVKKGVFYAAY